MDWRSITAIFAATIAVAQNDIKRILAYSTISQLGYMMLGLGVGGVVVGIFHLITHAFFKALLFLGAGSVIHGCTEEQQDIPLPGRPAPPYADHLCNLCGWHAGIVRLPTALLRLLEQGRNPPRRPRLERLGGAVLSRSHIRRAADRLLHGDPPSLLRLLRKSSREPEASRIAARSRRTLSSSPTRTRVRAR